MELPITTRLISLPKLQFTYLKMQQLQIHALQSADPMVSFFGLGFRDEFTILQEHMAANP